MNQRDFEDNTRSYVPIAKGTIISHYKIINKVGAGGMGEVFLAEDNTLKRRVALKLLAPAFSNDPNFKARFKHEAQAAAGLNHQNIVTVYELGEHDGRLYIAMEYVEGQTLHHLIRSGKLRLSQSLEITQQICVGLAVAHQAGVTHRDIKPANIIITTNGTAKILDFGLAKISGAIKLTKEGSTLGTIHYQSPEQCRGEKTDQRSDLFSLGVVLYEMLTGTLPFQGDHEAAVMYEILNQDPKPVETHRPDSPKKLVSLVHRLLSKDPVKRIGSAEEIVNELKQVGVMSATASSPTQEKAKSVAVLYFENLSSDKESDYFCAGMTEDIITDLSKIKELKVVSRTDMLPFRNKEISTQRIGEALNVNYILEGSVRKAGEKVRISAQLIDVNNGFHLWADRFDRQLEDIFNLQNEVSRNIAEALQIMLTASEKEALEKKPTDDLKAYDYYLRGKDFAWRRSRRDNEYAIEMFRKALAIDPNFAIAYTGLAGSYAYKYQWWDADTSLAVRAMEASQKAVELDPGLAEAHFALGLAYHIQNQYEETMHEYRVAISLKPDFYDAYKWLGHVYDVLGQLEEGAECYRKAAEIKPFSEEPVIYLEMNCRKKGNREEARKLQRELIQLIQKKLDVNPDDTIALSLVASAYADLGMKEEALDAIKSILEIDPNDGLFLYNIACTYAKMGEKAQALLHLKKAVKSGWRVRDWAKTDPDFDSIRAEEEFIALVRQMH